MPDPHLVVDRVAARGRGRLILDGLSFALSRGQTLALLGPEGAGKTATLLLLAGFLRPVLGSVRLAGRDITVAPAEARDVVMVFGQDALFPHLSVLDNVAFGLKMRGVAAAERRRRAQAALTALGLAPRALLHPARLAPAERRLVALSRAAAVQPALLLIDEPAGGVDDPLKSVLGPPQTSIFATHDRAAAFGLADRVALLREGRLMQFGTPQDLYEQPSNGFVANFTGLCNLVPVTLLAHTPAGALVQLPGGTALAAERDLPAGPALLCLRPHHARLDPSGPLRGAVTDIAYQGALTRLTLALPSGPFVADLAQAPAGLARGDALAVGWDPAHAWLLPAEP